MSRSRRRDEKGFTLVELIVAVVIQAMIVGALGMAFIGILRGTKNVNESLARSGDARIAAHYIISDARNSSGPETSLNDTASCPDASPPVAGTPSAVVRFNWNSTSSAGVTTANTVNYVLVSNSLLRRVCQNGTLISDRAVASNIQSVTVACSPTANCTGNPTSITAAVTGVADTAGAIYTYNLTGAFRKLNGTGPPVTPNGVILLGAGNCSSGATGIKVAGGASMRVYGNAKINTVDGSTCKAMALGTNAGNYQAGGTQFLSGGSCAASGSSTCPTSTTYSPALADPYANLTALAGVPAGACTGTNPTPVGGAYPSGIYPTLLNINSPGATLSGTYIFCNGLSLTNGATVTGSNVLLYFKGGSMIVNGNAQVSLAAPTSGSYKGLIVWQPATNSTAMTFSNGGNFFLDGAIYAPNAQVNFTGGAVGTQVTAVVALMVSLSGGATVTFGEPSATPLLVSAPASLPATTVNRPYSTGVTGTGGDGKYIWSATGLPATLTIDASTGVISGTPTASASLAVIVTLRDELGDDLDTQAYTLTVNAAPSITTASPIAGGDLTFAYSKTLVGSGGTTAYTWSATGLPAGLSISTGGVISGTPTATGTSTIAAMLTDAAGATATKNLSITIYSAPSIATSSPLPTGEKTVAYSTTVTASGGATPYAWSSSTLPAGLSIASGTGVISGTPTVNGSFTPTIIMTDATGAQVSKDLSMTINPQPSISSVVLANAASGGTAGNIGQGDTITVTYSTAMKASSFCNTWADGADRSLTGDNQVTVSVSNASPDTLSVTSTGCTFNFGTIALGSNSYVSSAATFKGTGSNISKIQWFEAQNKLVITLGLKTGGTTATVASSAPTYNASASIKDAQGASLSPTSFAMTPAAQRF